MAKTKDIKYESLPATTTAEQQNVTAGQRNINLIWENTQSHLAKVTIYCSAAMNILVISVLIILRNEISVAMA